MGIDLSVARNPSVMVRIFCVVAGLMVARHVYSLQMKQYESMNTSIAEEKEKGQIIERVLVLDKTIKEKKSAGLDSVDSRPIIEKMVNMALKTGLSTPQIQPGQKKDEKNIVFLPFTLDVQGTYRQLVNYLKVLESYPIQFHIQSIRLAPVDSTLVGKKDTVLSINLVMEAFLVK